MVARKIEFPTGVSASASAIVTSSSESTFTNTNSVDSTGEEEYADSLGELPIKSEVATVGGHTHHHECPDCGKAYSTSSNLARHRQTHR